MAIAYNSTQAGADLGANGGTGTLTASYTSGSGSLRLLVAAIWGDVGFGGADDITGVTYGGVSMSLATKASRAVSGADTSRWCYLYYLIAPATGANNLVVTSTTNHYLGAVCANYTGVKATGQPDQTTTNNNTGSASLTGTLTTIADNCWTIAVATEAYSDGTAGTAGAGTTRRTFDAAFGQVVLLDSNAVITPAGSNSLVYTTHANNSAAIAMASFAPDTGGGGGGTIPVFMAHYQQQGMA